MGTLTTRLRLLGAVTCILQAAGPAGAALNGASYKVTAAWIGGGAVAATTASKILTASIGQAAASQLATTTTYGHRAGFVQPVYRASSIGAITPDSSHTVILTGDSGCVQVDFPAGTFSDTVVVSVSVPSSFPAAVSSVAEMTATRVGFSISVTPALPVQREISYGLCYRDQDISGLNEARLRIARYISGSQQWLPLTTDVDSTQNKATASTPQLGTFMLAVINPAGGLENAQAFPNPVSLSSGQTLVFSDLPSRADIQLFTVGGEKIVGLQADDTGRAMWNGLNGRGEKVGSGVLLALLKSGSGKKILRIGVER